MSIENFKKQADRLIQFLGDKHRFRLKKASALEALAHMNEAADWNTLSARSDTPVHHKNTQAIRVLTWKNGIASLEVPSAVWHLHTLVMGSANVQDAWFSNHWFEALAKKEQALFILDRGASLRHFYERVEHTDEFNIVYVDEDSAKSTRHIARLLETGRSVLVFTNAKQGATHDRTEDETLVTMLHNHLCECAQSHVRNPLVVGISDVLAFDSDYMQWIMAQARMVRATLLLGVSDMRLLKSPALQAVQGNSYTQLYLGGLPEDVLTGIMYEINKADAVAVTPKTVTFEHG